MLSLFILHLTVTSVAGYSFGFCELSDNQEGSCIPLEMCPSAIDQILNHIEPTFCSFDSEVPLICCNNDDLYLVPGMIAKKQCEILDRVHSFDSRLPIINGYNADSQEYTHMAALGYGDEKYIQWICGGSLISEKFVLTAAHCLFSKDFGFVRWVRLGDLDLHDIYDDADPQDFRVKRRIIHPSYKPPLSYHDIALIELDRSAIFTPYVEPACLHVDEDIPYSTDATGWGLTQSEGAQSTRLQVAPLSVVENGDCSKLFRKSRKLKFGILGTQLCAGGGLDRRDTCKGDSGGPLQFRRKTKNRTRAFTIFAITSFGKMCGIVNSPSVYTRIAPYISWIESIAWPNYP